MKRNSALYVVISHRNITDRLTYPKQSRLLSRPEFQNVFNHGKKAHSYSVRLYYLPNNVFVPRLGIVVSKRVIQTAVHRNIRKRLIKESFRLAQHSIGAYDIVVLIKRPPKGGAFVKTKFQSELQRLWQKLPQTLKKP